mgnify:CR=1 FL=1
MEDPHRWNAGRAARGRHDGVAGDLTGWNRGGLCGGTGRLSSTAVAFARIADGQNVPFRIVLDSYEVPNGRCRWFPDGRSIAFNWRAPNVRASTRESTALRGHHADAPGAP